MIRTSVMSSTLVSVGYDSNSLTLEIEFRRGRVYQYFGVPAYTLRGLMQASSKGKYFDAFIRDTYRYTRI